MLSSPAIGRLVNAFADGIATTFDEADELLVDLDVGTLESRTEEAVLTGANAAAIGAHGRWQIVQFKTATQVSAVRWSLTGLLRGRKGTEYNTPLSVAADRFVMISTGAIVRLNLENAQIGAELVYRSVSIGAPYASGTNQPFIPRGQALECYSPIYVTIEREINDDLTITWIRRDRLSQTLRDGIPTPMSEAVEAYDIDIIPPGSPDASVRTIAASVETATYTAAQQATDLGTLAPPGTRVRVYQLSAIVGRGTVGEATL